MKTNKASVQPETLTDGSIVFNVIWNGEAVAHPPTQADAEAICAAINSGGRDAAITFALHYVSGHSFSNGDMVVGVSDSHLAVAFNNTEGNKNSIAILANADAQQLFGILYPALKSQGLLV